MATWSVIDAKEAPEEDYKSASKMMNESLQIVGAIKPNKVVQIDLGPEDNAKGVRLSLAHAARKLGKQIHTYQKNESVFVRLKEEND